MWRYPRSPPYARENRAERGLNIRGERELSRWRQDGTHPGQGNTPAGTASPSLSLAGRPHIEDGCITRVRVALGLGKLLQAGGDPRRGSAHRRPAPERPGPTAPASAAHCLAHLIPHY